MKLVLVVTFILNTVPTFAAVQNIPVNVQCSPTGPIYDGTLTIENERSDWKGIRCEIKSGPHYSGGRVFYKYVSVVKPSSGVSLNFNNTVYKLIDLTKILDLTYEMKPEIIGRNNEVDSSYCDLATITNTSRSSDFVAYNEVSGYRLDGILVGSPWESKKIEGNMWKAIGDARLDSYCSFKQKP